MKQIEQYYSDDYAGLVSGKYSFYYGYEVTDPNSEDDWCFQVKENNKVVYSLTATELKQINNDLNDCKDYLLTGIGMWLLLN